MAKEPYIPLYTGDWEKDMNVCSLETEAAWLRIVFKMHNATPRTGIYKTSTKLLQNLWRISIEKISEIINELKLTEVATIVEENGFIIFINRRINKQYELSKLRANSAKGISKEEAKDGVILDNDIEIEHEFEIFWNLYSKKIGKPKSFEIWNRLTPEERKACIQAVPAYVASREKQYRKDPERFLKHRTWEDELLGKESKTKPKAIEQALILMKTNKNPDWVPEYLVTDIFKSLPFDWKRKAKVPEGEIRIGGFVMTPERKELVKQYMKQLYEKGNSN